MTPDRVTCGVRIALVEGESRAPLPQDVSVDAPHRAAFEMMLSMTETTLFEAAMNTNAPTGTVEYQLRLTSRRPAIPAALTVDWNRAGEFFATQPGAGGPFSFGQIEDGVRQLVALGPIRIDMRIDAAGADGTTPIAQASHEAAMLVAAHSFDAGTATPRSTTASPNGADGPFSTERAIMDAHTYVRRATPSGGVAAYDLGQPRAGELTLSAADSLGNMMAAIPPAKRSAATLMEERPGSFTVGVMAFQIGQWIRLVEVTLTYGDRRVDLVLDPDRPSGSTSFMTDELLGHRVGYQYRAYVNNVPFIEASQSSLDAPPRFTEAASLVIDARDVFSVIPLRAVAMFPWEQYRAAFVDVKVDVPAERWSTMRTIVLDKDHMDAGFSVVIGRASVPAIQHRVRHVTQSGGVIEGPWQPTDGLAIVVGTPAPAETPRPPMPPG